MSRIGWQVASLVLLVQALFGADCVGDPLPQPPSFNYQLVSIERDEESGEVVIRGKEKSTNPDALLTFFNFDVDISLFRDVAVMAASDGSFEVRLPGWKINRYRVIITVPSFPALSVDFHGNYDGSITAYKIPLFECFHISDWFVDFGEAAVGESKFKAIEFRNDCPEGTTVELRKIDLPDATDFIVYHSTPWPVEIHSGGVEQIGLLFAPIEPAGGLRKMTVTLASGGKEYVARIVLKGVVR